jgi:outer membrane biosynthesis protein TonB
VVKRVLLGIVGALLVLVAAVVGSFAAWGYVTFGNGGSLRYDLGTVVPGAADTSIVVDVDRFGASIPYLDAIGETQLAARSAQPGGEGTSLFVGAARTPDADAFVKGTPYAVGIRTADGWQVRQIPGGSALPATTAVPWLSQASGSTALLDVPTSRPLTLVVARSDGAPVGAVLLGADFAVPTARTWAMWLGIAAAVVLIVGIVLLVVAVRRRRPRGAHEAGVTAAVAAEAAEPERDVAGTTDTIDPVGASDSSFVPAGGTNEEIVGEAAPIVAVVPVTADDVHPEPEPEPVVAPEPDAAADPDPEPEAEPEPDSEPEPEAEPEPEPDAAPEPDVAGTTDTIDPVGASDSSFVPAGGTNAEMGGEAAPNVADVPVVADVDRTAEIPVVPEAAPPADPDAEPDEHQPS